MLLSGLICPNFETDRRNIKRAECFSDVVLHVCEEERQHVSIQKLINKIHLRAAVDSYLRSSPLNKPFFILSLSPLLLRQKKY